MILMGDVRNIKSKRVTRCAYNSGTVDILRFLPKWQQNLQPIRKRRIMSAAKLTASLFVSMLLAASSGLYAMPLIALAQNATESGSVVKPGARSDDRPVTPSVLERFGDAAEAMQASTRGAETMRGGMIDNGRRHISVRRPGLPAFGDWPASEITDLASDELAPVFDEAEQVVDAFKAAIAGNEIVALAELLGIKPERLLDDETALNTYIAIRDGIQANLRIEDRGRRLLLLIGEETWPFPFPIVRDEDGKWSFDTMAGLEEIVNRRVGTNELEAIATAQAYLDAQRLYAMKDRDGDGVLEYAQNLISSPDTTDGLFWPDSQADEDSLGGEFLNLAENYRGYYGYKFRVLKGQGENVPGGSYDYVINGNMVGGFGLIAWPASYAESGLHTFVVNHNGTIYEADLGRSTDAIVKHIKLFDPDDEWEIVSE
jgi:hypothetical protein